ncbi:4458_t:CDS:2 [Gigaspora margarita]|uniref:4458_t:CDS:1 n=1 Tax=Gigaspora margarita TaxID=4874 RepID=A0ABN7VRN2_GIGMA|nr:4458_t:CDS:2 [Gigaspora margarita]
MAKLEHKKLTGYERKVHAYLDSQDQVIRTTIEEHLIRKSSAEEASPIITSLPNLRDRTNEPSVNSFDDHNEESAEVKDRSTEAPLSNDYYESDAGIAHEGDNNPFIAQTGKIQ